VSFGGFFLISAELCLLVSVRVVAHRLQESRKARIKYYFTERE